MSKEIDPIKIARMAYRIRRCLAEPLSVRQRKRQRVRFLVSFFHAQGKTVEEMAKVTGITIREAVEIVQRFPWPLEPGAKTEVIHTHTHKNRARGEYIVRRRTEGAVYRVIAEEMSLSLERVRQLHRQELHRSGSTTGTSD